MPSTKTPSVQVEPIATPPPIEIPESHKDNFWFNPMIHPQWARLPTDEPLSQQMMTAIKLNLRLRYRTYQKYYKLPKELSIQWSFRSEILGLGKNYEIFGSSHLRQLCNKLTCFYWPQRVSRHRKCTEFVIAALCREWYRCHNDDPPGIHQEYFFAKPVRITSEGPTTIPEIVEAHLSLCEMASGLLSERHETDFEERQGNTHWPDPRHYKILPLFRSIVIVLEELADDCPRPHRPITLDDFLKRQSVLLVRTGDESGLSEPISFEVIEPFSNIPSPMACGIPPRHSNAIRVSLETAVKFVTDLQQREEQASNPLGIEADSQMESKAEDQDLFYTMFQDPPGYVTSSKQSLEEVHNMEYFVRAIMRRAREVGIDNVSETWSAVREVKAAQLGEEFVVDYGPYEFSHHFSWR